MANDEVFRKALAAAAAVTGMLRRGGAVGLVGLALSGGCSSTPSATRADPSPTSSAPTTTPTAIAANPDAGSSGEPLKDPCRKDPGFNSECCKAERARTGMDHGRWSPSCTPWGPPAPPPYRGEALAVA